MLVLQLIEYVSGVNGERAKWNGERLRKKQDKLKKVGIKEFPKLLLGRLCLLIFFHFFSVVFSWNVLSGFLKQK